MANLIIKPASSSDNFKIQDGAATDLMTVSTNKIKYSKGIIENVTTAPLSQTSAADDTVTINLALGTFFEFQLGANALANWTFTNIGTFAPSGTACSWIVKIKQHGSSAVTVAYPASVHWAGGVDHVMSTGNNNIDIISMFTVDGGTTIYASQVGKAFA
jgi:hypothetical protein